MENDLDTPKPEQPDDPGRSRERERQDALLDRTAREESWLARLRRWAGDRKGRPRPGSDDLPDSRNG
jgi:hypothetical protein